MINLKYVLWMLVSNSKKTITPYAIPTKLMQLIETDIRSILL